jgi:CDP-4-dehydro-6-deoxyglucose reductase
VSFVYELVQQISLTPTVSQLFFKARRDFFSYEAGQYLEVVQQDGTFIPLSIANAPLNCAQIEIHLAHPNNNLPAQKILRTIAEDAVLTFRGPFGVCTKNKLDVMRPIIFIVRETGFAPVQAILESFSHDAVYPPMYLYWS